MDILVVDPGEMAADTKDAAAVKTDGLESRAPVQRSGQGLWEEGFLR